MGKKFEVIIDKVKKYIFTRLDRGSEGRNRFYVSTAGGEKTDHRLYRYFFLKHATSFLDNRVEPKDESSASKRFRDKKRQVRGKT